MNILIAGDGEVGFNLAQQLSIVEDHNIVVVDPNEELLELLGAHSDILTIPGDSCSVDVLEKANVKNTDLLISVLHEEATNILTCIIGKKLGAKRTIARINSLEMYKEERREFYTNLGIDKFVGPEQIAAKEIVNLLNQTGATEMFTFGDKLLQLLLIRFDEEAEIINKPLVEINKEIPELEFRVVAIHRNRQTIIPMGDNMIKSGDLAYIITKTKNVKQLLELCGKEEKKINSVMIIGAGRIGKKTALRLEEDMDVKLIEIDRNRCRETTEMLNSTLVINGDATDINMLREEGLEKTDALIALTNNSETNILACLHAKKIGVHTTIALVENIDYIDIAQTVGIDTIINKKLITASYIARFTISAEIESAKVLSGVSAEVLEFVVKPKAKVCKRPIKNLRLPAGSIIGGIIRGNDSYIAIGDFQIEENDRVVVFAEPYAVKKLPALFN